LWGQYDAPDYVRNLIHRPVIAYSGEIDPQKQAAAVMEEAFAAEGAKLRHLIGPGMGHKYDPDSLREILAFCSAATKHAAERKPRRVQAQTKMLRYMDASWVSFGGLKEHWQDARIDAEVTDDNRVLVTTKNVSAFLMEPPFVRPPYRAVIDGQMLEVTDELGFWNLFVRSGEKWNWLADEQKKRFMREAKGKTSGCQGPIDDAFTHGDLLVVRPTGKSRSPAVQKWVDFELTHLLDRWRATFRGELPVKDDIAVTNEDLTSQKHLILWGDEQSNQLIARLHQRLPIHWQGDDVVVGPKRFPAAAHIPLLICRNPHGVNSDDGDSGYIVLNSGPTFREAHDATNFQQNPKLPDWAIVDLSQPPDDRSPGKIVAADFFDEEWKLKPFREP